MDSIIAGELAPPAPGRELAPRNFAGWNVWRGPLACLLLGIVCLLTVDRMLGAHTSKYPLRGELGNLFDAAEHFGTPYGQLITLLTLFACGAASFPRLTRVFAGATAAGLAADVAKLMVARTRPRVFNFESGSLWDGFTDWFPFGAGGAAAQSLPSGHTASAFGFAVLMIWAFPQGRPAFLVLAVLTALQRVLDGAHFASDVCLGAALGWTVGLMFTQVGALPGLFDRWESRAANASQK